MTPGQHAAAAMDLAAQLSVRTQFPDREGRVTVVPAVSPLPYRMARVNEALDRPSPDIAEGQP